MTTTQSLHVTCEILPLVQVTTRQQWEGGLVKKNTHMYGSTAQHKATPFFYPAATGSHMQGWGSAQDQTTLTTVYAATFEAPEHVDVERPPHPRTSTPAVVTMLLHLKMSND